MYPKLHSIRFGFGRNQRGMSLVEILVAMAIALVGITVMFQIYSVTETRKRSIAGNSDSDVSGRIALLSLSKDVSLAGFGFSEGATSADSIFGCEVSAYDGKRSGGNFTFPLTPLLIQQGGGGVAGDADTIIALHGSSNRIAMSKPIAVDTATNTNIDDTIKIGRGGVQNGDLIVVFNAATKLCALHEITDSYPVSDSTATLYLHNYSPYNSPLPNKDGTYLGRNPRYNHSSVSGGIASGSSGGKLYDLGGRYLPDDKDDGNFPTRVYRNIWSVSKNGKLAVTNDLDQPKDAKELGIDTTELTADTDAQEIADSIINLQAVYGVADAATGVISKWVDCGGAGSGEAVCAANPSAADLATIRAVRVAILMRGELDSQEVAVNALNEIAPGWVQDGQCTFTQKAATATDTDMTFTVVNIDGSACTAATSNINNWKHYRYNVFETVITLKNIAWGSQL